MYLQLKSARSEIVIYKLSATTNTPIWCQRGKHFEYVEQNTHHKTKTQPKMYNSFIKREAVGKYLCSLRSCEVNSKDFALHKLGVA